MPANYEPENAMGNLAMRSRLWRATLIAGALVLVYLAVAYVLMPALWSRYAHRHPAFEGIPELTYSGDGHPADPLNVALAGTERELKMIMIAAHWYPADPLSLKSCLEIAEATVLKRPYDAAPVSSLYLFEHKEDLAFEKPVGDNPRSRHHVRFWRTERVYGHRPVWVGAAMFDRRVGLNRTTAQITHLTGADIDAERDYLFHDVKETGDLAEFFIVDGFHNIREGKNGEGEPWHTDGNLWAGVIAARRAN